MLRRPARIVLAAIACVALESGFSAADEKPPLRVLFTGNSLTSWHNLAAFVAAIARASGDRKPGLALHAWDGLHPSRLGTYLAALVVYAGLRHVSPSSLPSSLVVAKKRFTVSRANAAILRASASEVLARLCLRARAASNPRRDGAS